MRVDPAVNADASDTDKLDTTSSNNVEGENENGKDTRDSWDHTNRKVMVYNIYKFTKIKQLEKTIESWVKDSNIEILRLKKPSKTNWVQVTLKEESMVEEFIKIVGDGKHKNKKGGVIRCEKAVDGMTRSKRRSEGTDDDHHKKRKVDCVKTSDEVRDSITPLWKLSYEEQLQEKSKTIAVRSLSKITSEVKKKFRTLQKEARRSQSSPSNLDYSDMYEWMKADTPIPVSPIIGAPKKYEYRNKCELTFGYHHEYETASTDKKDASETETDQNAPAIVKTPACGFMAGGWTGGVSSPNCCQNVPDEVCGIAEIVNEFLRTSPLPPYDTRQHRGVWRFITIRTSERTNECMVVICHAPPSGGAGKRSDGSDDYTSQFDGEKQRLIKLLTAGNIKKPIRDYPSNMTRTSTKNEGGDMRVTSLFFQEFDGVSNPTPSHPVQHVYGKQHLEEKLLNCTFQISPGAFFQVTTDGAEVLYKVVVEKLKEVTSDSSDTLLFDVCCGTGTIGLTCLKEGAAGRVVGIDISEPAIKDALINAKKNGYSADDGAVSFVASRAEAVMHTEIKNAGDCSMVAIVDPARDGLHQDVVRALRNTPNIQRIIYVSCNPTGSLVQDGALLCSPPTKRYTGLPFKPTSSQPVDMFPLTPHCELVIVFDRMSADECIGTLKQRKVQTPADD